MQLRTYRVYSAMLGVSATTTPKTLRIDTRRRDSSREPRPQFGHSLRQCPME